MKLLRARDIAALDAAAAAHGIPTRSLMQRAGEAVAREAMRLQPGLRRALVLAGPGNNGGDGYVAAGRLAAMGVEVELVELRSAPTSPLAAEARADAMAAGGPLRASPGPPTAAQLERAELIVDALLGVGLSRPAGPELTAWFEAVRRAGKPLLAVDLPSGLDADLAVPIGPSMQATWTLQLGAVKPAAFLRPACGRYGQLLLDDLGLPPALVAEHAVGQVVDAAAAGGVLPRRRPEGHKFQAGSVLVVGGSASYPGAPELAARAALRAGAGYVALASPSPHPATWPELVQLPWAGSAEDAARMLATPQAGRADARLLGPGLVADAGLVAALLGRHGTAARATTAVLDGGALIPALLELPAAQAPLVLTPHAGEAARLLGRSSDGVARDPLAAATELAARSGAFVVLKGAGTVVAAPDGELRLVEGGPAALATAGSGDVLAGIVAAVLAAAAKAAATASILDLLAAAVCWHAEAGRRAAGAWGDDGGLVASDLVAALPAARAGLRQAAQAATERGPDGLG